MYLESFLTYPQTGKHVDVVTIAHTCNHVIQILSAGKGEGSLIQE